MHEAARVMRHSQRWQRRSAKQLWPFQKIAGCKTEAVLAVPEVCKAEKRRWWPSPREKATMIAVSRSDVGAASPQAPLYITVARSKLCRRPS